MLTHDGSLMESACTRCGHPVKACQCPHGLVSVEERHEYWQERWRYRDSPMAWHTSDEREQELTRRNVALSRRCTSQTRSAMAVRPAIRQCICWLRQFRDPCLSLRSGTSTGSNPRVAGAMARNPSRAACTATSRSSSSIHFRCASSRVFLTEDIHRFSASCRRLGEYVPGNEVDQDWRLRCRNEKRYRAALWAATRSER